jgi:hypothetical protein
MEMVGTEIMGQTVQGDYVNDKRGGASPDGRGGERDGGRFGLAAAAVVVLSAASTENGVVLHLPLLVL